MRGLESDYHPDKLLHREVTEAIIGAAFEVHNTLGFGFLEKVYQRPLQAELIWRQRRVETERGLHVADKGVVGGEYFADAIVDDAVLVELMVAPELNAHDEAQLINALKATGIRVGLLINFGRNREEHRRRIL